MELKSYRSRQFAGTLNREISFQEGMNVVLGDNETGKSTMISGIYETLHKTSKLDKRKDKDKEFTNLFLPSNGSEAIDGMVAFEHDNHEVVVEKRWVANASTDVTIDGIPYRGLQAEEKLQNVLQYSEALYRNVIFGRQENMELVLEWIFSAKETSGKEELEEKLKGALSISEGISINKMEQLLKNSISYLSERWDLSRNYPEKNRDIHNPWKIAEEKTNILNAFYAWQKADEQLQNVKDKISELEEKDAMLLEAKRQKDLAEKNLSAFLLDQSRLYKIASLQSEIRNYEREANEKSKAQIDWPHYTKNLAAAVQMQTEKKAQDAKATLTRLDNQIKELEEVEGDITELTAACKGLETIDVDCTTFFNEQQEQQRAEVQLNSGAMHAKIAMENGHVANIETATKHFENMTNQELDVAGYLNLTIPNVGEIIVIPQNVDVAALKNKIADCETTMQEILNRYLVASFAELEKKKQDYIHNSTMLKAKQDSRKHGESLDELKKQKAEIQLDESILVRDDLQNCIQTFLAEHHFNSLEASIAIWTTELNKFVEKYSTQEALEQSLQPLQATIETKKAELSGLKQEDEIPMTSEQITQKQKQLQSQKEAKENAYLELHNAVSILENQISDFDFADLEQSCVEKKQLLDQRITLCNQYKKIADDLQDLKEKHKANPMQLFYDTLADNLAFITDGQIQLADDMAKYSLIVRSKNNKLAKKEHLSEGTKKTILLAYRLAVLKHFFPDNGAMIILDDILLDMDPGRREKSVKLLQRFAEHNQVILTTCDPEIAGMLGGNLIQLSKQV